jgi:hypothetical protein
MDINFPRFFKVHLKIFVCVVFISSLFAGSSNTKLIEAFAGNSDLVKSSLSLSNSNSSIKSSYEKPSQSCLSSLIGMKGIRLSTSIVGKSTAIQNNIEFIPFAHTPTSTSPTLTDKTDPKELRVALVFPTFTAAAYDRAFYSFYRKHIDTRPGQNVTQDLDLLSTKVENEISPSASGPSMIYLVSHLQKVLFFHFIDAKIYIASILEAQ